MRHLNVMLIAMVAMAATFQISVAQSPTYQNSQAYGLTNPTGHNTLLNASYAANSTATTAATTGMTPNAKQDSKVVPVGWNFLSSPDCDDSEVACDTTANCCPTECGSYLENFSVFLGLDGSKQPQDFGVNALFGGRFDVNLGVPLIESIGLGIQAGTSLNYSDNAVQVFERIDGTSDRFQNFTTVGLFQRTDSGFHWAVGYDFLYENYYDKFNLGQWRGDVGVEVDETNEIGTWFAISSQKDSGFYANIPVTLDPITQGSIYFRHTWENDAQTTFWLGIAEGHGEVNLALGDLPPVGERLVFGADVFVPLSPRVALFGQANFLTPADTGTVDAYLGLAFYPGGSHGARKRRFAPPLPVANNTTFANDLSR